MGRNGKEHRGKGKEQAGEGKEAFEEFDNCKISPPRFRGARNNRTAILPDSARGKIRLFCMKNGV